MLSRSWMTLVVIASFGLIIAACEAEDAEDETVDTSPTIAVADDDESVVEEATPEPELTPTATPAPELTPTPEPTPTPEIEDNDSYEPVSVDDEVTVLTNGYGLPDGTGYNAVAVFWVTNSNEDVAVWDLTYRVTYFSEGEQIYASDGRDRFSMGPGTMAPIVHSASTGLPLDMEPDDATVQIYDDPEVYVSAEELSDLDQWSVTNEAVQCDPGTVACEGLGDVTWNGDVTQVNAWVTMLVYEGNDPSGPIIAAGAAQADRYEIGPGQTVPFTMLLRGFEQPEPTGAAEAPDDIITAVYVRSHPERN